MGLRLAAPCPACGAPIGIGAGETAVRCDRCAGAHLVLHDTGTTVAELDALASEEEARALACAVLEDEMRRRGRSGPPAAVESIVPFSAPVRVVTARLHEAAVVRGETGDPATEVTVRRIECARTALLESLRLPTAAPLAGIDASLVAVVARRRVVAPPFGAESDDFEGDVRRLEAVRSTAAPALVRSAFAFPLSRVLLLRPCRLVLVSSGRAFSGVLVDDAARQAVALLSKGAAEALRAGIAERPLPVSPPPVLRPMRCPECASPLPLDREGQLRICPACRRAFLVAGRRLARVPYEAELPPSARGRVLVPAWRIPFVLVDPRDGAELASVAAVRARCGEEGVEAVGPAPLDVPAFLPADRKRERAAGQRLPALAPEAFPCLAGPARGESGFPDPRPVGALGPLEAAGVVRHALLASLRPSSVAIASARRLKELVLDAPLRLGAPRLVLRCLRRVEAEAP